MRTYILIIVAFFIISCNTEPQPLVPGKDECHFCKMPVADTKYGAEIITVKGKIYKFDDIICMINFLKSGLNKNEKVKDVLAVNYFTNQKLMDVNESVFLKNANFRTPMNSGIAAFESPDQAKTFLNEIQSETLNWQQLQEKLK